MLRIQLLPSGEFLNLATNSAATVSLFGSIMNKETEITGSFGVGGKAPLDKHNKRILGNAHLISSSQSARTRQARLWLGIYPWKVVKFVFNIADNLSIDYNLIFDNGIAAEKLKSTYLHHIYGAGNTINIANQQAYRDYMKDTALAEPGRYPLVFFPIRNENWLYADTDEEIPVSPDYDTPSSYVNEWNPVTQQFVTDDHVPGVKIKHLESPAFYLSFMVKRVIEYLGYRPVGNWFNDPDVQRLVIYSPIGINTFGIIAIADPAYYMPKIALNEFFKALRSKVAGLLIAFNETDKTCLVDTWDNILGNQACVDLRSYQLYGNKDYVPETDGYTLTEKTESKDALFNQDDPNISQPAIVIGSGTSGIELAISTTNMVTEVAPGYVNPQFVSWRVPHVKQLFNTADKYVLVDTVPYKEMNDFQFRLLYYHGMKPDQAGNLYPYASADNKNWQNQPIGKYTLALDANNSTRSLAQKFYQFKTNSKKIEKSYLLPQNVFMQISNEKRVLVRDDNEAVISCILDELTADLGENDMIYTKAVMYTLPAENNITSPNSIAEVELPPVYDNGEVWVKIDLRNMQQVNEQEMDIAYQGTKQDVWVTFWADAVGTVPKPVINLQVKLVKLTSGSPEYTPEVYYSDIFNGTEVNYLPEVYTYYTSIVRNPNTGQFEDGPYFSSQYSLITTGEYHVIV